MASITCVEFPGVVKSMSRCMKALGPLPDVRVHQTSLWENLPLSEKQREGSNGAEATPR